MLCLGVLQQLAQSLVFTVPLPRWYRKLTVIILEPKSTDVDLYSRNSVFLLAPV